MGFRASELVEKNDQKIFMMEKFLPRVGEAKGWKTDDDYFEVIFNSDIIRRN